jgi:hypothetical protein
VPPRGFAADDDEDPFKGEASEFRVSSPPFTLKQALTCWFTLASLGRKVDAFIAKEKAR